MGKVVFAVVTVLIAAGCGDSTSDTTTSTADSRATTSSTASTDRSYKV